MKTKATQEENSSSKPNKNNQQNKPKGVVIANQSMGETPSPYDVQRQSLLGYTARVHDDLVRCLTCDVFAAVYFPV